MTYWDRMFDRKFSGLALLATGAAGISLGYAFSAVMASWNPLSTFSNDDITSEQQNESEQDLMSEPETPRDLGDGTRHYPPRRTNTPLNFNASAHNQAEYKQVILIRTDLDMVSEASNLLLVIICAAQLRVSATVAKSQATGKIAAQACHASVTAVKKAWKFKDPAYKPWVRAAVTCHSLCTPLLSHHIHSCLQESSSASKVCLAVDSEEELLAVRIRPEKKVIIALALVWLYTSNRCQ